MNEVAIRLPRTYDVARMQAELELLENMQRVPAGYAGESNRAWESISLYAPGGRTHRGAGHRLPAPETAEEYRPTEALESAPYFAEIIEGLACQKRLARLLSLGPGGIIAEHRDEFISFQEGILRLHIPVVTHPDVDFYVGGYRCDWKEGELWYGDFSQPHRAHNRSPVTRVHLVIDVLINDFVLSLFPSELIELQRTRGIRVAGKARFDEKQLQRFAFEFCLPAGFVPPGTDYAPLREPVDGRIQALDGKLMVLVNEQPLLRLEPLSERAFSVQGLAPGTTIECEFEHERIVGATLVSGVDGSRIHLPVRKP